MRFALRAWGAIAVMTTVVAGCAHQAMKEKEVANQKTNQEATEQKQQLEDLARDAYTFGFPLVLTQVTSETTGTRNWFDLSQGPVVISVPDAGKRYYVGTIFDAWSNVVGVVGTRTTKNKKAHFVIVGPQWKGELPSNTQVIESPTNIAWFSTYVSNDGTARDMVLARQLKSEIRMTQTARNEGGEIMNRSMASTETDFTEQNLSNAADKVFAMDADTYYRLLCALMVTNPPSDNDVDVITKFQSLGVQPTNDFDLSKLNPVVQDALNASVQNAKEYILAHQGDLKPSEPINGWTVHSNVTGFATDYSRRAYVAVTSFGAPQAQDELIYSMANDNLGQKLNSGYRYQITFAKAHYPPTASGWALFAEGAPTRAISSARRMKKNSDGSLTIYIQKDNPGKARVANWLPAPQGEFNVSLRLYSPKQSALEMTWEPPTIEHVIETSPLVMEEKLSLREAH